VLKGQYVAHLMKITDGGFLAEQNYMMGCLSSERLCRKIYDRFPLNNWNLFRRKLRSILC
jgi:hypothetical protein